MPFVETSGQRLYYEDSGGSGPAVAFSHGFLLDHSMFDAQVAALSGDFRCITWDERGHGMSDCKGSFDFYDSANDLVAILNDAGVERASLVGMSQGGFLSQRLTVNYPDRVQALVLIDTAAALFSAEELAGYQAMADAWISAGPVGELADQMAGLLFGPDYDAAAWIGKWRSKPPADTAEPWRAVLGRDEFLDKLGGIACPSLVIHGSNDGAFDLSVAEGLRDHLGACKGLVVVEGGHHAPNVTHPEPVNAALREFLAAHA